MEGSTPTTLVRGSCRLVFRHLGQGDLKTISLRMKYTGSCTNLHATTDLTELHVFAFETGLTTSIEEAMQRLTDAMGRIENEIMELFRQFQRGR